MARRVVYLVAASVDGQIAREDGSFDCFLQEGDHVADYIAQLNSFDDVLMGRATYEVGTRVGVTNPYPSMRGHVFSSAIPSSPDPNITVIANDAAGYVARLKQQPGRDIYLCGGGKLAASLLESNLIDELIVKVNPLLIGSGTPLFTTVREARKLELRSVKTYENGVVLLSYGVIREGHAYTGSNL